ncbi:MAG: ATP-binding cassette domain-containing protein [Candidatus Omnitrophica bacterium]|nr:ATP-binding cassette domain-containing protein [Candidatus Omnitrophota bacterium]
MDERLAIKVQSISKKYCKTLKRSMIYGLIDIGRNVLGLSSHSDRLRKGDFWALDDISFELRKGEALGVIGSNGAGKSTLLKLLNGIFWPDKGKIQIRGRVSALIEVGAGLNPLLTGRENIYVNGAILGMNKKEVDRKFDSIVEFADIGDFLDAPVKHYSSGMVVRLGFAVAVHCEPDILLVDEVLSVGDAAFSEKCMRRMNEIRKKGTTIVFVSHSLYRIEAFCNRVLWLEKGRFRKMGKVREVVSDYIDDQQKKSFLDSKDKETMREENSSKLLIIERVELADLDGNIKNEFEFSSTMNIRIYYNALKRIDYPLFNLKISCGDQELVDAGMLIDGYGPEYVKGRGIIECRLAFLPFAPRIYDIVVFVRSRDGIVDIAMEKSSTKFSIKEDRSGNIPMNGPMALALIKQGGPVYIPHEWSVDNERIDTIIQRQDVM